VEESRLSRVTVRIPYALRPFTHGAAEITVEALTLRHALSVIDRSHPGLCARVLTPEGNIRPNVNVFVGDASARDLDGLDTPLGDDAVVSIIPAVAGG
jgi:molybdopterin converting factor small subunit